MGQRYPRTVKKHRTSVTPGLTQDGDIAGDGPAADRVYWQRILEIWQKHNKANINKIPELKDKYRNHVYSFYKAVCDKYKLEPEPPIPPEFDYDSEQEDKVEAAPPGQPSSSSGDVATPSGEPPLQAPEGQQPEEVGTPKRKRNRGAKKKLTGDQRRKRRQALTDAQERDGENP